MRLVLLSLALTTFFLSGCKKKNLEYELTGVVYDGSFNTPKANCEVRILGRKNGDYTLIGTVNTDASGTFSYHLKRELLSSVKIAVQPENYFQEEIETTLDHLDLKKPNAFNFTIYAKSWAKIHLISDGSKKINLYRQIGKSNCDECCAAGPIQIQYIADTTLYCINNGNQEYQILYDVLGTNDSGTHHITTTAFDTTTITINY